MDQLRPKLIQEADERLREVCQEIEKLQNKRRGIVADTQNKRRKVDQLEENIKRLKNEKQALWEYRERLRDPGYMIGPG